jgi:hypothetical protein
MEVEMRPNRTEAIVASLAAAAVLTGPVFADQTAVAGNTDEVTAMSEGMYLIQPSDNDPAYMLPPLSDHLLFAQQNDDRVALEQNNAEEAVEEDDGTAKEYNRGYYAEPTQIARVVLVPTSIEAIETANVSEDGTARQYDRGYYKEPETIVALIVVSSAGFEQ